MTETVQWYAWEILTGSEANAWFLMMAVFTFTCLTFIATNIGIRSGIHRIQKHLGIKVPKEDTSFLSKVRNWFN
tara:strand:+ start:450 stop:671 length:222 start_codon:yes stop_codon:yes gene_type:complete